MVRIFWFKELKRKIGLIDIYLVCINFVYYRSFFNNVELIRKLGRCNREVFYDVEKE